MENWLKRNRRNAVVRLADPFVTAGIRGGREVNPRTVLGQLPVDALVFAFPPMAGETENVWRTRCYRQVELAVHRRVDNEAPGILRELRDYE